MRLTRAITGFSVAALVALCLAGSTCTTAGPAPGGGVAPALSFTLVSGAFVEGSAIPTQFTALGENVSPPLSWTNVPTGTRSFTLTMTDDNAPGFTQWVIYNIPVTTTQLPQALPTDTQLRTPVVALQGVNSAGGTGYTGPNPPVGATHTYRFTLYALDTIPNLTPGADIQTVLGATAGRVIRQAELTGTFARTF